MNRRFGYGSSVAAFVCVAAGSAVGRIDIGALSGDAGGIALQTLAVCVLLVAAVALGTTGGYFLVSTFLLARATDKRRERILDRLNEHPDRVAFPVSRN